MEFQRSSDPTDCDTCLSIVSFFNSLRDCISTILADEIVVGKKLPDIDSEQIVPANEVKIMVRKMQCSDDQLDLADTTETNPDSIRVEEISATNQVEIPVAKSCPAKDIKYLEKINEKWRRKREHLIQKNSINLSPTAKMDEQLKNNQLNSTKIESMGVKVLSMPKAEDVLSSDTESETAKHLEGIYKLKKCGGKIKYKKISPEKLLEKMKNLLESQNKEIEGSDASFSEKSENNRFNSVKNESMDLKVLSMPISKDMSSSDSEKETTKHLEGFYKLKKCDGKIKYKRISQKKLLEEMKNTMERENKEVEVLDVSSGEFSGYFSDASNSKERYERCWRNRDKLMREESSKYPSLTKLIKVLNRNPLQCANVGMECSGETSSENEINSPSTSIDSSHSFNFSAIDFNNSSYQLNESSFPPNLITNSEESLINFSREMNALQSRKERGLEDLLLNNRSFHSERIQENASFNANINAHELKYIICNKQINDENPTSKDYCQRIESSTSSNLNDTYKDTDDTSNHIDVLKLEDNAEECVMTSEILEYNLETPHVLFPDVNTSIEHNNCKSRFEEANADIEITEINRNSQSANYNTSKFPLSSISNNASSVKDEFLKKLKSVNLSVRNPACLLAHKFFSRNRNSIDAVKDKDGPDKEN